jgi:hypothetical protein
MPKANDSKKQKKKKKNLTKHTQNKLKNKV